MPKDDVLRPTRPDSKQDTQPIKPVSRASSTQIPTEIPATAQAQTETSARAIESPTPPAPLMMTQPMATSPGGSGSTALPSQAQVRLERSVKALWVAMFLVTVLALASLAVNALLVSRLLAIRNQAAAMLDNASKSLDNLSWQGISFDFPFSQTVNYEGDIPFEQDINFPFKGNIPINTTVSIPIDLGPLGTQVVRVPVNTTVPVDMTVPVHVKQNFHVKTQVPVRLNVPIHLSPNDPPLKDLIAQARQLLDSISQYFK